MGYVFHGHDWTGSMIPCTEADAMHALLVARADALEGCTENSPEGCELEAIRRGN